MICVFTGGDSDTTEYDAEIHSYSKYLKAYRSDVGGATLIKSPPSVKTALLIRLSKMQMYATNYEGFDYYKQDTGLFAIDTMYMGLNRVVENIHEPTKRTGRGLCSVCVYFLKETVSDLHDTFPIVTTIPSILDGDMFSPTGHISPQRKWREYRSCDTTDDYHEERRFNKDN